jgi:hypothetical protein
MEGIIAALIASPLLYPLQGKDGRKLMSLFGKILDKLGLNKKKEAEEAQAKDLADMAKKEAEARAKLAAKPAASAPVAKPAATTPRPAAAPTTVTPAAPAAAAPAAPKAISEVDVVKQLEQKAKGTGLNWKQSIVDLLTLLDIEHSREARVELAKELGAPEDVMGDSARMNTWLHKTVLKKIAENGGNIPANLLD